MTKPSRTTLAVSINALGLNALAIVFTVLTFFPYVALPMGNSTNVPLAAIAGVVLSVTLMSSPKVFILLLLGLIAPFIATLVRLIGGVPDFNVNSFFTSPFGILTVFGAASALLVLRQRIVKVLTVSILASSLVAVVQKYLFLDRGIVPWLELYDLPGYASVASNAEIIGLYIRRPFGFFPEPSFLAGTLALATAAVIFLSAAFELPFSRTTAVAVLAGVFVIFISDSGSGIVCIVLLALALFVPVLKRRKVVLLILPFILGVATWLALSIASSRQGPGNTSWNDRFASISAGFRLLTSEPLYLLVGVGRGMVPVHFRDSDIFGGITIYSLVPDIYSVLGRVVLENGLIFGLPIVVALCFLLVTAGSTRPRFFGFLLLGLWLVVAGLTISYETASWIWVLPGLALGSRLLNHDLIEREKV